MQFPIPGTAFFEQRRCKWVKKEAIIYMSTLLEHELIIPDENFPFKIFEFEGMNGNYFRDKHWHSCIELFAVYEGLQIFYLNEEKYTLYPGEFFLVNNNEVHSVHSPIPNLTIVLQIPMVLFSDYFTTENFILFTHDKNKKDKKVTDLIRNIYEACFAKKIGYEFQAKRDFNEIMYLMVTQYRIENVEKERIQHNRNLDRLEPLTSYMHENYQKEITLESLSEHFGYSPSYISRMFGKYAQTNYKMYLQGIRVEHADQELRNTNLTISEIAERNGFPNNKAFAKAYRKTYGVLPSEIRKRQKSAIN